MTKYIKLIGKALDNISNDYYRLKTTYEPSGIVRERVFCYELYHQIRIHMGGTDKIFLNGEIDKRGHVSFSREDQKNPDFVFHIPGINEGDTLVVEVKGKIGGSYNNYIIEDLKTIAIFINKYKYTGGVFILYNHNLEELMSALSVDLQQMSDNKGAENIYIVCKKNKESKTEMLKLNNLDQEIL